jgi:hypothetical protein
MITVETKDPVVFSNANGDKKAKREERITKLQERGKRWDEAGVFSALKNLALTPKGENTTTSQGVVDTSGGGVLDENKPPIPPVDDTPNKLKPWQKWSLIIGGVALVGYGVYYFGFRKKAK